MSSYGQFCPVALAAEILTRRWTPLVVRELLCGSTRFNELRRGVPKMSPSLLSKRLDELVGAGVVRRHEEPKGRGRTEYRLTPAGRELTPIIEAMGVWGKRWVGGDLDAEDLDVDLLMWDVRRRIDSSEVPKTRTVVHFTFRDCPEDHRDYWIVTAREEEVDLCLMDPGHTVDLMVRTDVRAMTDIWMGRATFAEILRRRQISLRGPAHLRRSFPRWLGLSVFARVEEPTVGQA